MVGVHLVCSTLVLSIISRNFSKSCLTHPAHPCRGGVNSLWERGLLCWTQLLCIAQGKGGPTAHREIQVCHTWSLLTCQPECAAPSGAGSYSHRPIYPCFTLLEACVGYAVVPHKWFLHDALQRLLIELQMHLVPKGNCQRHSKGSSPHFGLVWERDGSHGWVSDRSGDSGEETPSDLDFCNCELVLQSGRVVGSTESCSKTDTQSQREKGHI